jgi:hypothetical protein
MKALVSPKEKVYLSDGSEAQRIAQVIDDENVFEVASPLFWIDCPLECTANEYCFLNGDVILKEI